MIIQLNADRSLNINEGFGEKLKVSIWKELARFTEHITRLEIHLSDENGDKAGPNDKKCLLEAHLGGHQPVVVVGVANSCEQSLNGALDKMKASLEKVLGRLKDH